MLKKIDLSNDVDKINIRIVSNLHQSGRITKVELSEKVGLSPTPCWERMKRLEQSGIIKGYYADINLRRMLHISYFRVEISLNNYCPETAQKFDMYVKSRPEIVECEAVLGDLSYIIKIASSSVEKYQEIIESFQNTCPVSFEYTTYPVTKTIKDDKDLHIQTLYESLYPEIPRY